MFASQKATNSSDHNTALKNLLQAVYSDQRNIDLNALPSIDYKLNLLKNSPPLFIQLSLIASLLRMCLYHIEMESFDCIPYANNETYLGYDYNNNGIFNEKDEVEYCTIDLPNYFSILHTVALSLLVLTLVGNLSLMLAKWHLGHKKNGILEGHKYSDAGNHLAELEDDFNSLSADQKNILVSKNLAEKDSAGSVTLKFICPISLSLIIQPLEVFSESIKTVNGEQVREMRREIYDEQLMRRYLNQPSPLTKSKVVNFGFSQSLNEEHCTYLLALSKAVKSLKAENTLRLTR